MPQRKRYVSYLDKPYKQREFCNLQQFCENTSCPYKFKPSDFRKLAKYKGKQRVDWTDYPECEQWIIIENSQEQRLRKLNVLKMAVN